MHEKDGWRPEGGGRFLNGSFLLASETWAVPEGRVGPFSAPSSVAGRAGTAVLRGLLALLM